MIGRDIYLQNQIFQIIPNSLRIVILRESECSKFDVDILLSTHGIQP